MKIPLTLSRILTPWRRRVDPTLHAGLGEPERSSHRWLPPWWLLLLPVLVTVSLGAVATWPMWRPDPSVRMGFVAHDRSIAVLMFRNRYEGHDYLAQGIREDIVTQLSQLQDLVVNPNLSYRSHVYRRIGAELAVRHLLRGTVRRADDKLRIRLELMHARSERTLWEHTYEVEPAELPGLPGEIALQIATALKAELSEVERRRLALPPTNSAPAYDAYLHGITSREYRDTAIVWLRQAVTLDTNFAAAHANLAPKYVLRTEPDWQDTARTIARRAIRAQPESFAGHSALAEVLFYQGRPAEAHAAAQRAFALAPNAYDVFYRLMQTGRDPAAKIAAGWYAMHRHPRSESLASGIAFAHIRLGNYAAAERWLRLVRHLRPDYYLDWNWSWSEWLQGKPGTALKRIRSALERDPDNVSLLYHRVNLEAAAGQWENVRLLGEPLLANHTARIYHLGLAVAAARVQLGQVESGRLLALRVVDLTQDTPRYSQPPSLQLSQAHAWAGDIEAAFASLHDALEAGYVSPDELRHFIFPDAMRADPRFPPLIEEATKRRDELRRRVAAFEAREAH